MVKGFMIICGDGFFCSNSLLKTENILN